jgi:hypothetical protein
VLKVEIDTSQVNRIEYDIAPPMRVAITLPLRVGGAGRLKALEQGFSLYVALSPSAAIQTHHRLGDVAKSVLAAVGSATDACLTHGETCEHVGDVWAPGGGDRCSLFATRIVYRQHPGERPARMCDAHAGEHITHGAIELVPAARR